LGIVYILNPFVSITGFVVIGLIEVAQLELVE